MQKLELEIISCTIVSSNGDHIALTINKDIHGPYQEFHEESILKIWTAKNYGVQAARNLGYKGCIKIINGRTGDINYSYK